MHTLYITYMGLGSSHMCTFPLPGINRLAVEWCYLPSGFTAKYVCSQIRKMLSQISEL